MAVKQIHIILESFLPLQRAVSCTKTNLLISLETLKKRPACTDLICTETDNKVTVKAVDGISVVEMHSLKRCLNISYMIDR